MELNTLEVEPRVDSQRYIPFTPSPVKVRFSGIPKGYLGTRKTLEHIQRLIRQGAKDFFVRQKAIDILLERGIQPKDYLGEINALFKWVQRNVRYTKDPFRVEVLHTARRMLELLAGDCDDKTILLGAMLEAIGHPTRLIIVGPDPSRPRYYSHIYLEVNHRGKWIPLDATMPHPLGWAPGMPVKRVVPISIGILKRSDDLGTQSSTEAVRRSGKCHPTRRGRSTTQLQKRGIRAQRMRRVALRPVARLNENGLGEFG